MSHSRWKLSNIFLMVLSAAAVSGCASLPRALLSTDPLSPHEHVTLAASYLNEKRDDLAEREYRAALTKDKKYWPAILGLGNVEFGKGEWKKAEKYYRRALKLSPGHPGASNNLAMAYLRQEKKLDEAERLVQVAMVNAGPVKPYLLDTLANLYIAKGSTTEARTALDQAWTEGPQTDPQFKEQYDQTLQKISVPLH